MIIMDKLVKRVFITVLVIVCVIIHTGCGKKEKDTNKVIQTVEPTPYQAEYYLVGSSVDIGKYIGYINDISVFIGKGIKVQGNVSEIGSDYAIIGNDMKFRGNLDSDVLTAIQYGQEIALEGEVLNIESGIVYMNNTVIINSLDDTSLLKVNDERIDVDKIIQASVTSGSAVSGESIEDNSVKEDGKPASTPKPETKGKRVIVIKDRKGLDSIRDNLTGSYELGCNIKVGKGRAWEPIANFEGKLDGHGFKISGVNIVSTSDGSVGLFGSIGNGAQVKNLKADIRLSSAADIAGGLVGTTYGDAVIIDNCHINGSIAGSGSIAGGLVGLVSGTNVQILNSSVSGNIRGTKVTGGLIGRNRSGISIKNCYVAGDIESGDSYSGGIIGINECKDSSTQNCYYYGAISGGLVVMDNTLKPSRYGGGIAGLTAIDTYYKNCYCNETKVYYFDARTATKTKRKYRLYDAFGINKGVDKARMVTGNGLKKKSTFKGFNFSTVWGINAKINKGLPILKQEYYINNTIADKKSGRYKKSIVIRLNNKEYGVKIYYTLNNKVPKPGTRYTRVYKQGSYIKINKSCNLLIQTRKTGYKTINKKYVYRINKKSKGRYKGDRHK